MTALFATGRPNEEPAGSMGVPIVLLLAAVLFAYAGSMGGVFVFDDIPAILENPTLRDPNNLTGMLAPPGDQAGTVGGRPLVNLSLAINYALAGTRPWGYHALNLGLHAAATLLLFGIFHRTLDGRPGASSRGNSSTARDATGLPWRSPWSRQEGLLISFVAALLWSVHPLNTEAVTYVVQRAESMMGLFFLSTLYCFLRYAQGEGDASSSGERGRRVWAVASFLSCLLGMATKEVMAAAPLIVLLYDRTFLAGSLHAAWSRRRGLYVSLFATWILLALLVIGTKGRGGSAGIGATAAVGSYALTQSRAIVHYLRLAVWPDCLVFDYGTGLVGSLGEVIPQLVFLGLILTATALAVTRRPAIAFLSVFFFAVLAPSSSIVPIITEPMAEHRMYLPLAAVTILAVTGAFSVLTRFAPHFKGVILCAVGIALACGLGASTARRNSDYLSEIALWSDTVRKVPGNPRAHNNLAEAFRAAGDGPSATAEFVAAVLADPNYAPAQYNLGVSLLDSGRANEAIPHLEKALTAPRHQAELHLYLGEALERTGRYGAAADSYRESLRLAPANAEAAFGYGNSLGAEGRYAEAVEALRLAATLAPDRVAVRNNLANALLFSGRRDEAIAEYRGALRLDPGNESIRNNLERAIRGNTQESR